MDTSIPSPTVETRPFYHPLRLFVTIAGMFGWRLDRGPLQAMFTLGGLAQRPPPPPLTHLERRRPAPMAQ